MLSKVYSVFFSATDFLSFYKACNALTNSINDVVKPLDVTILPAGRLFVFTLSYERFYLSYVGVEGNIHFPHQNTSLETKLLSESEKDIMPGLIVYRQEEITAAPAPGHGIAEFQFVMPWEAVIEQVNYIAEYKIKTLKAEIAADKTVTLCAISCNQPLNSYKQKPFSLDYQILSKTVVFKPDTQAGSLYTNILREIESPSTVCLETLLGLKEHCSSLSQEGSVTPITKIAFIVSLIDSTSCLQKTNCHELFFWLRFLGKKTGDIVTITFECFLSASRFCLHYKAILGEKRTNYDLNKIFLFEVLPGIQESLRPENTDGDNIVSPWYLMPINVLEIFSLFPGKAAKNLEGFLGLRQIKDVSYWEFRQINSFRKKVCTTLIPVFRVDTGLDFKSEYTRDEELFSLSYYTLFNFLDNQLFNLSNDEQGTGPTKASQKAVKILPRLIELTFLDQQSFSLKISEFGGENLLLLSRNFDIDQLRVYEDRDLNSFIALPKSFPKVLVGLEWALIFEEFSITRFHFPRSPNFPAAITTFLKRKNGAVIKITIGPVGELPIVTMFLSDPRQKLS